LGILNLIIHFLYKLTLDLSLKEYKINEKEILKILTEVAVTRSEAEIVRLIFVLIRDFLYLLFFNFYFFTKRNWMKKILEKLNELTKEKCLLPRDW